MIKGDLKISEPGANVPQIQPAKKTETNFAIEETRLMATAAAETGSEKLDVKIRFARLKRRMRSRSSSIF
jgi:hypothetical protein